MREEDRIRICDTLLDFYKNEIPPEDLHCAKKLEEEWKKSKPFKGKHILFNGHITLSTLITLRLLLIAGADLDISATSNLVVHDDIANVIKTSGLNFYRANEIPKNKIYKFYDIIFDCGAELLKTITPKDGTVELTQTDKNIYQDIGYPVISVDISETKKVETGIGTGEGLTRVILEHLMNTSFDSSISYQLLKSNNPQLIQLLMYNIKFLIENAFKDKKVVLLGGGKVGKGIMDALVRAGADPKNITVVDISPKICEEVQKLGLGYNTLLLSEKDESSIKKIKETFKGAFCLITATGVESVVSKYFTLQDIENIPMLMNMGTYNEYDKSGKKIPIDRIFNNGKPANFALKYPTPIRYLDAVFTLLAKAGEELKNNTKLSNGLHPVSSGLDSEVLSEWKKFNEKRESQFLIDKNVRRIMKIESRKTELLLGTNFFTPTSKIVIHGTSTDKVKSKKLKFNQCSQLKRHQLKIFSSPSLQIAW